jgi:hypothetical protein
VTSSRKNNRDRNNKKAISGYQVGGYNGPASDPNDDDDDDDTSSGNQGLACQQTKWPV